MSRTNLSYRLIAGIAAMLAVLPTANTHGQCADDQCSPASAALQVDAQAIVRITHERGRTRALGSGTLIEAEGEEGIILTCGHLFREGAGSVVVSFVDGRSFGAAIIKIDPVADLAALRIRNPQVPPIALAPEVPRRGEALISCGYGGDGRLSCNRGQLLGYARLSGAPADDVLELSGSARQGDSGGPVLDRQHRLVAVLFGTDGHVVDATHCGRVRRFLKGLLGQRRTAPAAPTVVAKPPALPNAPVSECRDELNRLAQSVREMNEALSAKVDGLAANVAVSLPAPRDSSVGEHPNDDTPSPPATADADSADAALDNLARAAEPWLSAKVAGWLVAFGVPGGLAGVAAGGIVWLVMRRSKRGLQGELSRLRAARSNAVATAGSEGDPTEQSGPVERHHNRYVPYEVTALDRAWAAAHAQVGEKYPGAVPYLKMVEGVKDQLLAGSSESQPS